MQILLGYDAFAAALGEVHEAVTDLDETRADATSRVDRLLDGGWSGRAAESFAAAWDDWLRGARQVSDALASIESGIAGAEHGLATRDEETADAVARLTERLGA